MNTEGSVTNSPLECQSFPVNPPNMFPLSDLTTVKVFAFPSHLTWKSEALNLSLDPL